MLDKQLGGLFLGIIYRSYTYKNPLPPSSFEHALDPKSG